MVKEMTNATAPLARALLDTLHELGVELVLENGKLKTRSPPGAITPELANSIREHKQALIELLGDMLGLQFTQAAITAGPIEGESVLSFSQQRFWFLDQLDSGKTSYNMPIALRLDGPLDRDALQRSFDEIVSRHAILRTVYRHTVGGAEQIVRPAVRVPLTLIDISHATTAQQAVEVDNLARAEAVRPFDLSNDLMLRISLAVLSPTAHVLYLTLHHISGDGWSHGLLVKEFNALYEAYSQGFSSPLRSLHYQYADFARWQRRHFDEKQIQQELAFWRETLDGLPMAHSLPLDRPRGAVRTTDARIVDHRVAPNIMAALHLLAIRNDATLFMLLQSAFALLMLRWSQRDDIAIGTPVAGRQLPATESLIGCFVNTLVLRTKLSEAIGYDQLLRQSKSNLLAVYEHQWMPFELLVESLNPERSLSHSPLFQVMFALQNYQVDSVRVSDLCIKEVARHTSSAKFDLTVIASEAAGGLDIHWVYSESLFDEATIQSLAASFETLLEGIILEPQRDVFDLPLLNADRHAIVLAQSRAAGRIALDERGRVQPHGALGRVYVLADEQASDRDQRLDTALEAIGGWGRLRSDGTFEIVAQEGRETLLNGTRIAVHEIDSALMAHANIAEAYTLVRSSVTSADSSLPVLISYVVLADHADAGNDTLVIDQCVESLRHKLPDIMRPKAIVAIAAIPRTAQGQIDIDRLPAAEAYVGAESKYAPPQDALEKTLCAIWRVVLSLGRIGIHDNFFEAGGASLHIILVQQAIRARTGREVSVNELFTYPTVAGLARFLQSERPSALDRLLQTLTAKGVTVFVQDNQLRTRGLPGAITDDLAQRIRANKQALIDRLSQPCEIADKHDMPPVLAQGEHPLSFAQQRLWFLNHFESGLTSYNIPVALRLEGKLDQQALLRTFDEVVSRHAILRTTYDKSRDGGVQRIHPPMPVTINHIDLGDADPASQEEEIARLAAAEVTIPFDLRKDLMLRVSLARLSPESHVLLLTLHHIAADGWSLGVLVKEFTAIYEAYSQGKLSPLPPLHYQYVDFAKWQRGHCTGAYAERELSFWRETLSGIAALHSLPLDKPRPLHHDPRGRTCVMRLNGVRLTTLKQLAKNHNVTLFMVLQSAFSLLLARWSERRDVTVGTPVAGRVLPMTEPLIGCFVNTLVLRTTLDSPLNYQQLLEQSRRRMIDAYDHQHLPFEMLVESLNPERSLSHSPLFQVMFALQNYQVGALHMAGIRVEEINRQNSSAKFDLTVLAYERLDGLDMSWVFSESLFDEATIRNMASSFETLLGEIVLAPQCDVFDLPLLNASGHAAVLAKSRAVGRVVLDERGRVQPLGAVGRVYALGDDQALDRAHRLDNVLQPTGEWGRLRADGTFEVVVEIGRETLLNGTRIPVHAIDQSLMAHTDIAEAYTLLRTSATSADESLPVLVTYVVLAGHADASAHARVLSQCSELLQRELPDFMRPKALVAMDAIPRNAQGWVDIGRLPAPELPLGAKAEYAPPQHALEETLCAIWRTVLSLKQVGIHDNFFEAGGTSLHCMLVQQEILAETGREISVTDLFTYPTVAGIARFMQQGEQAANDEIADATYLNADRQNTDEAIAVIGMAGRFPDANDADVMWENIRQGLESWRSFSDEELRKNGIRQDLLDNPDYVKGGALLQGIENFDANYFGFTPREAEVTDPQQRLLFECAIEALEHAGYGDDADKRSVAVFVGVGESRYLFENLLPQSAAIEPMRLAAMYGNRSDYAATRLSYRLNLSGPSVSVGTACSTSLVAVHQACNSLRQNECSMALAGGASISQLGPQGYLYHEGGISSPDGHCRAFDSEAKGTRGGSGAGLVLLKRLSRALADGDTIYAIVKGSAINNDGADKVGYTAPSVLGQAQVVRRAHRIAGVDATSIQYVEAHGTATPLGDPIEIKALTRAFDTSRKQFCAIGSIKTNIGHLDAAAGVAGLIKTIKALGAREVPPSINYQRPNPKIDFGDSPFFVNTELRPWPADQGPRRAGVSSFGIGGTNAHVVLEEAPETASAPSRHDTYVLVLSAKSEQALSAASANLRNHLQRHGDAELADVAYTLQVGRAKHAFRSAVVTGSASEAIAVLSGSGAQQPMQAHGVEAMPASIVFLFTGQGSQYPAMGRGLYHAEPYFKDIVDHCAEVLREVLQLDLRDVLFAEDSAVADDTQNDAQEALFRTEFAQPALFVLEYALALLLIRWGVVPAAMIGHSLGEYVAACVAGVFSLDDALRLVARRGQLMQRAENGRMLSLQLAEHEARPLIAAAHCDLAAVNSERDCVASGTMAAIQQLATTLSDLDVPYRELRTSHAFHSTMMNSIAEGFRSLFAGMELRAPSIPYISNVSGRLIEAGEATNPDYWVRHMLGTVRFADGVETLASDKTVLRPQRAYVEIGPGAVLSALLRRNAKTQTHPVIACLRHRRDSQSDRRALLKGLAQLWLGGASIDWARMHEGDRRHRIALPTYPFERQRYWIDKSRELAKAQTRAGRMELPQDWFYLPVWRQLPPLPRAQLAHATAPTPLWLILCDEQGIGDAFNERLVAHGHRSVRVLHGQRFEKVSDGSYRINPAEEADYQRLVREFGDTAGDAIHVMHLWSLDEPAHSPDRLAHFEWAQERGFGSLLFLSRALVTIHPASAVAIDLVTHGLASVGGEEKARMAFSTLLGLAKVLPQELPQVRTYHIDVQFQDGPLAPTATDTIASQLLAEASAEQRLLKVAYRGRKRWGMQHERCMAETYGVSHEAKGLNYVITGGLGHIGMLLAEHLAEQGAAGVLLISRRALPSRDRWDALIRGDVGDVDEKTRAIVQRLRDIEARGTKLIVHAADASNQQAMHVAFDRAEAELGSIEGVIHGAGKVHAAMHSSLDVTMAVCNEHFLAKVHGTHVLEQIIEGRDIGFCMLMSSLSSVLGGLGFGAYAAANSYMDAFAQAKHAVGDHRWMAVNWDGWSLGQAKSSTQPGERTGMTPVEGVQAFGYAMRLGHMPQIVHSTHDVEARIQQWLHFQHEPTTGKTLHARPAVASAFVEPTTDTEQKLVSIWQDVLGIEQIGIRDNFFELGGDSLMLVQVHKAIRAQTQAEATVAHLFQFPCIGELATFLDQANSGSIAENIVNKRLERRRVRGRSQVETSELPT